MMTDKPSSELSAPGCNFIQVWNQQSSILIDPWFQCNSNPQSSPIPILYPWCSLWFHPQSSLIPIRDLWYSLWPDPQSSPILDPWSRLEIACSPLNCETNASLNPINATLLLLQGSMVDEEPSCFISRQCSPDMKRKILFVKLPPHPSVLYRSAACPFFLMGQRQRCKNFQLFTRGWVYQGSTLHQYLSSWTRCKDYLVEYHPPAWFSPPLAFKVHHVRDFPQNYFLD